jgi:hypothetical protein
MYRKLHHTHCRKQKAHKNPASKQMKTKQWAYLAETSLTYVVSSVWNTCILSNVFYIPCLADSDVYCSANCTIEIILHRVTKYDVVEKLFYSNKLGKFR